MQIKYFNLKAKVKNNRHRYASNDGKHIIFKRK